jgi:hypothetical protein
MELLAASGEVLARSSQPCMLRYPGSLLRRLTLAALRLPLVPFYGITEVQVCEPPVTR